MMLARNLAGAFIGCAAFAGAAAQAADAGTYKVVRSITSADMHEGRIPSVYVRRNPGALTGSDLIEVKFETYTLLAANDQGEHVSCTGLKIQVPENSSLSFATGFAEAFAVLYPKDGTDDHPAERSYGSCVPVDVSAGYKFNNTKVAVLSHDWPEASFGVPILGNADLSARTSVGEVFNAAVYSLYSWGRSPCDHAGWNDEHAAAAEDQNITVGFCPR